jgi:hypothetical protein
MNIRFEFDNDDTEAYRLAGDMRNSGVRFTSVTVSGAPKLYLDYPLVFCRGQELIESVAHLIRVAFRTD